MNVSSINANFMTPTTSFGCSDPNCKCQAGIVSTKDAPKDTLELSKDVADKTTSFGKKIVNGAKKAFTHLKNNPKQVKVVAKAAFDGLLTACAVLGANDMIEHTCGQTPKGVAGKCALGAAVIVAAARMVQNRNAFMEKQPEKK